MKNQNQHTQPNCLNCASPLVEKASYCSDCGQKRITGKITFRSMIAEFFSATFNLDNKIFRTIRDIFVPGKLSIAYFKGQHKRYLHPIRFFLVMLILLIPIISHYVKKENFKAVDRTYENIRKNETRKAYLFEIDTLKSHISKQIDGKVVAEVFDSLHQQMSRSLSSIDSINLFRASPVKLNNIYEPIMISKKDILELAAEDLLDKYQIEGTWKRLYAYQQHRLFLEGSSFFPKSIGYISWSFLLMMPVLALVLRLFSLRKDK